MDIQIQIPVEDAKIVFHFLASKAGQSFGDQLMPIVGTMDAIAKALRAAGHDVE